MFKGYDGFVRLHTNYREMNLYTTFENAGDRLLECLEFRVKQNTTKCKFKVLKIKNYG